MTFWPWNWCALLFVASITYLPILRFLGLRSRLMGQHLSDTSRDSATLTFDLVGHGTCCWCRSSCSICVPSLKFVGLPVRKIMHIYCVSINRPGDLDLWHWNWCALLPVGWTIFLPILVFVGCYVLDLSANTCQTHHVTLQPWPWRSRRLLLVRIFVLRLCTNFVGLSVRKILRIYCVNSNRPGDFDLLTSK